MGTVGRVIGISLLTLVPGISGGSETYARELVRALGRVGGLDYCVFLPHIAPDVDGPGEYRGHPHLSTPTRNAQDERVAARLWEVSEQLTGVSFELGATAAA